MVQELIAAIARALDRNKISYMLIGGQAVLLHGMVRLTEDIDITLGIGVDRLGPMKKILRSLGLVIPKNVDDDFVRKTNVLIAVDKVSGIRTDFIFSFTPYERQALKKAKIARLDKYPVRFASCEDTIIHKIFASRPRDLEDAKAVFEKNKDALNIKYIRRWLKEFSDVTGHDLLEKLDRVAKDR